MNNYGKVAFALGGLGGHNAHGAGVLQAAFDKGLKPGMISCTSGQIGWVHLYLKMLTGRMDSDLRTALIEALRVAQPSSIPDLNLLMLSLRGVEGKFKCATRSILADVVRNAGEFWSNMIQDGERTFVAQRLLELLPCRWVIPDFGEEYYEDVSETFNHEDKIGIAFNSYNPTEGCERVYLNDRARHLLKMKATGTDYLPETWSTHRTRTEYDKISPEAVRSALWLNLYGFNGNKEEFLDGAYFREIMLSELNPADTIFVARPIHYHWHGDLPRNWPNMEDFKTKVAFNGAYAGERDQIGLMNKLIRTGRLGGKWRKTYHLIRLKELEVEYPRGFFGYAFEDINVFDDSHFKAMQDLPSPKECTPPSQWDDQKNAGKKTVNKRRRGAKAQAKHVKRGPKITMKHADAHKITTKNTGSRGGSHSTGIIPFGY